MVATRALSAAPLVGTRLARYEVLGELAAGGMGVVYLARSAGLPGFEKLVALKTIHAHLAREREFLEMFIDEARITAMGSHPNVCQVFEAGSDRGIPFLVMELLQGQPLSDLLPAIAEDEALLGRATHLQTALRVVIDACEGLHAMHELRDEHGRPLEVVHRDINPRNLFVTYEGAVKVLDFGVARARGRLHETGEGFVKGKVAYMSPEQLRGRSIDRRADVWALGVTLWECLTCDRLFVREGPGGLVDAVMHDRIEDPREVVSEVPAPLAAIAMRALERDPDQRYSSARALGHALQAELQRIAPEQRAASLSELMGVLFRAEREDAESWFAAARQGGVAMPLRAWGSVSGRIHRAERTPRRLTWLAAVLASGIAGGGMASSLLHERESPPPLPSVASPEPERSLVGVAHPPLPSAERLARRSQSSGSQAQATGEPSTAFAEAERPSVQRSPADEASSRSAEGNLADPRRGQSSGTQEAAMRGDAAAEAHRAEVHSRSVRRRRPLSVVTPGGWAELEIDGRGYGRTPKRVELAPGRHRVVLRPFGEGVPVRRLVRVPQNERLIVRLERD